MNRHRISWDRRRRDIRVAAFAALALAPVKHVRASAWNRPAAVRFTPQASSFALTLVAPRVISPSVSDPNVSRVRFTVSNPDNLEVTIRIFDISGAKVKSTAGRESQNVLYWDGTNDSGSVVKSGVYIYQIESGGKSITGTVAVAR